ncbi:MAG TPA: TonB family protein [Myxococcaceae bacterium]|jgi:protein TonB
MFDVVRGRSSAPTRLRPALVVSVSAHVLLLAGAIFLSRPAAPPAPDPVVRVRVPHGLQAAGGTPTSPPARPPRPVGRKPPRTVRAPVEISRPVDLQPRTAPDDDGSSPGADVPGPPGPGGGGGPECATPPCGGGQGGLVEEDVVAEVPVLLSGPEVTLSPEARRTGVEGTMLVRCVITATGTVEGCEVLRGVPLADAAVLAALRARQYRPAQVEGRAVSVRHLFTIKIRQAR